MNTFARAVTMQVNSQILFGDELGKPTLPNNIEECLVSVTDTRQSAGDKVFLKSCLRYSWDGGITAEISRQIPAFLAP